MALKDFAASEAATAANMNGLVNNLPNSGLVFAWVEQADLSTPTDYPATPQVAIQLRPAWGDNIRLVYWRKNDNSGSTWWKWVLLRGSQEELLLEDEYTSTSWGKLADDLQVYALDGLTVGDCSGVDVELRCYIKKPSGAAGAKVKDLHLSTGNAGLPEFFLGSEI